MKLILKFSVSILFVFIFLSLSFAQDNERIKKIEEAKRAFLTERLLLNNEQANKFWPIYSTYSKEKRVLIENYKSLKNEVSDSTISIQTANEHLKNLLSIKLKEHNLEKKYAEKFLEVLPPHKVGLFLIAERDFPKVLYQRVSQRCDISGDLK